MKRTIYKILPWIYKILSWIALALGIWYLVHFAVQIQFWTIAVAIQFWTKNLSLLPKRPAHALGVLVVKALLALVFFILWGWYGRKADLGAGSTYARLFKATHPANTVGCSNRDWLVVYAEGGTPPIVYKFAVVCLLLGWTSYSISYWTSYWTSFNDFEPFSWFVFARALFGTILRIVLVVWGIRVGYRALRKRLQRRRVPQVPTPGDKPQHAEPSPDA